MAALGKMSAGLAHELNNPAAAVRRSADQLRQSLDEWQAITVELDELTHGDRQHERVHALRGEIARHIAMPAELDPLARSDLESDLQTWLEDQGVDEAWELAPPWWRSAGTPKPWRRWPPISTASSCRC
jgi:hypothetical protein